ncbi:MAG TPA: UDP-N-acetylmuramoyl-L-alanine--D-glutamate ligase, partial [Acidimicrobiaceae bacterium]|nr:UDP-N-acetylmuramoyl-L-alanine--D-glutamate ligase [Acidimicrobiaceae bacterium]
MPAHHDVYRIADGLGRPVVGDFDLAACWDDRPVAAVTGTNAKTTVTTLAAAMLARSGTRAVVAGNTDVPLVEAVDRCPDAEMFVVEASSFRLARAQRFAPQAAAWLNLAPDHLDWHGDMAAYEAAKARIWRHCGERPDDVAVLPAGDERIAAHLPAAARRVTFAPPPGSAGGAAAAD